MGIYSYYLYKSWILAVIFSITTEPLKHLIFLDDPVENVKMIKLSWSIKILSEINSILSKE